MIKLFEEFENKKFEIGDRFRCINQIVFFEVGDIGILSKIEKFFIDGDNIVSYVLINKHGANAHLLLNVLEEAFIKIKPSKKIISNEDPFGEEEWEDEINENHELDPFGEEEWNDNVNFKKHDQLLAKKNKYKWDKGKIIQIVQGKTYWIKNITKFNNIYYTISEIGSQIPKATIKEEDMNDYFQKLPGIVFPF